MSPLALSTARSYSMQSVTTLAVKLVMAIILAASDTASAAMACGGVWATEGRFRKKSVFKLAAGRLVDGGKGATRLNAARRRGKGGWGAAGLGL